ncbi:MAG: TIGR02147 family protein [Pseudobdellovibrionaceae bacterium]
MDFENLRNYRVFVREYLKKMPSKGRGEIAKLASFVGVHPTFVSQVLTGKKEFNLEQSFSIAEYLNLTETERKYFLLLVQHERAGTQALKNYFKNEIELLKKSLLKISNRLNKHRSFSETDKAIFYSSWMYSAIRLYCSIGKGKTLEEIVKYFSINRKRALQVLEFLCEKNLCVKNDNRYLLGSQHTHVGNDSPFLIQHHMNWRSKSLRRHEAMSEEELAFTAPMSISVHDFKVIREKIMSCIKDSVEVAKDSEAEDIAFLTIDWLWAQPKE